ncbi:unnamed protein product [Pedinophyceae sp. YPF-701]|nr:unnamed protein product [Pedinophyceae sp. YPF-701]
MSAKAEPKDVVGQLTWIVKEGLIEYQKTPLKVRMVDAFVGFELGTAAILFLYMLLYGTFPFNSFLAAFLGSLAMFSVTLCLRMQIDPVNRSFFPSVSSERAYADFAVANALLHLAVLNYVG